MKYTAVIPAAGSGKRMGLEKSKLFIKLAEIPIIVRTLAVFEKDSWCDSIVLVVAAADRLEMEKLVEQYGLLKVAAIVTGGPERQHSVFAGLKAVRNSQIVVVHDGARPFIQIEKIHDVVLAAEKYGAAVLGVPVNDTIKYVHHNKVIETPERKYLRAIQTPQAFYYDLLNDAHLAANREQFIGTDDATLVERIGHAVAVVPGDYLNIKITTREDLIFARGILHTQSRGGEDDV